MGGQKLGPMWAVTGKLIKPENLGVGNLLPLLLKGRLVKTEQKGPI